MSEMRRMLVSLMLAAATVGMVACAKVPQAGIDQAQVALEAAKDVEAAVYAETEWQAAALAE